MYFFALLDIMFFLMFDRLQRLQNNLARVVLQAPARASATDLRRELHWLPIQERVKFKIATLTFKAKRGVPDYLCSLLTDFQPTRTLRSSDTGLLHRPRTSSDFESYCLRVQYQLSGTHCLLLLGLLIALVLLGLDLKLTYSQKPMSPSVSVTQRL